MLRSATHPSYIRLARRWAPRPLRSEREYDLAVAIVSRLAIRDENTLDPGEQDYLDAAAAFIEEFDARVRGLARETAPLAVRMRALMESAELNASRLAEIAGVARSAMSEVLAAKRELSKPQIRRLANHFKLSADYFL